MPELVNMSVGSLPGTSGLDSTTVWPLLAKKSRKVLRMSATVNVEVFIGARLTFHYIFHPAAQPPRPAGPQVRPRRFASSAASARELMSSLR